MNLRARHRLSIDPVVAYLVWHVAHGLKCLGRLARDRSTSDNSASFSLITFSLSSLRDVDRLRVSEHQGSQDRRRVAKTAVPEDDEVIELSGDGRSAERAWSA